VGRPSHLPSTYQYQVETGYWHDSASGLFYHPVAGMYWDPRTEQYLAWNAGTQQYVLVPKTSDSAVPSHPASSSSSVISSSATVSPATMAAAANATQATAESTAPKPIRLSLSSSAVAKRPPRPAATQPAARSALPSSAEGSSTAPLEPPPASDPNTTSSSSSSPSSSPPATVEPTSSAAAVDVSEVDSVLLSPHFDLTRLACLLCQRGFASVAQLKRHVDQSALHAKNVEVNSAKEELKRHHQEEKRKHWISPPHSSSTALPTTVTLPVPPSHSSPSPPDDGDVSADASMSVGERIMAKLGWRGSGHGLGKSQQGMTDTIQVQVKETRAGIGSVSSSAPVSAPPAVPVMAMDGPEGYKQLIKQKAQERFQAMQSGQGSGMELLATATPQAEAARHYLALLEKARAVESEAVQHRRPLMK
jgi:hypothetical protein